MMRAHDAQHGSAHLWPLLNRVNNHNLMWILLQWLDRGLEIGREIALLQVVGHDLVAVFVQQLRGIWFAGQQVQPARSELGFWYSLIPLDLQRIDYVLRPFLYLENDGDISLLILYCGSNFHLA